MAIAVQIDIDGGTLHQYDEAIEMAGYILGRPLPEGGLFHWVAKTGDGIRVVNVWASRGLFDAYAETLAPVLSEVGVDPSTLRVEFFEVHNYFATGLRG
jgi:hypothetical protein